PAAAEQEEPAVAQEPGHDGQGRDQEHPHATPKQDEKQCLGLALLRLLARAIFVVVVIVIAQPLLGARLVILVVVVAADFPLGTRLVFLIIVVIADRSLAGARRILFVVVL